MVPLGLGTPLESFPSGYLMVSLGVKSLQDENFGVERPFGVRLQLHQLDAIIQRLEQDVSINSRGFVSEISRVDISFAPMILIYVWNFSLCEMQTLKTIFISKSFAKFAFDDIYG